jgi:hypothetical protein
MLVDFNRLGSAPARGNAPVQTACETAGKHNEEQFYARFHNGRFAPTILELQAQIYLGNDPSSYELPNLSVVSFSAGSVGYSTRNQILRIVFGRKRFFNLRRSESWRFARFRNGLKDKLREGSERGAGSQFACII